MVHLTREDLHEVIQLLLHPEQEHVLQDLLLCRAPHPELLQVVRRHPQQRTAWDNNKNNNNNNNNNNANGTGENVCNL